MNTKKTINAAVAIFAIAIFLLATAPRLFAENYSIYEGQSQEIKFNNFNSPVTITGIYKELIDLNTGKILAHSPIYNNSENPIYLNSNNQYRINISFTASKDISNFADIGSSLVVNAINSENTLMPLGAYYNHNEVIKDLKLSIAESESGQEKYKYSYSYIIDEAVFKEIEKVSNTYNEKPKHYTLTIGEWAKINFRNIQTNAYRVGNTFDIDGYTLTIKEIKEKTTPPGLKYEVTISISGNGLKEFTETYESGDYIFDEYLNTKLKVNTVYNSRITIDKETLLTTDHSDYISFSNYADMAVKITDKPLPQTDSKYAYKLEIPCAIDRTKIILPTKIDPNYAGQYKTICNSSAYFNQETGVYHFKKNEGYYLNLEIINQDLENPIVNLQFYKENETSPCFVRTMEKSYNEKNKYIGKIGYVHSNDSKDFGLENMAGFIESCGHDKPIDIKTIITTIENGEQFTAENIGTIKYIVVDSDNTNIVAENARDKEEKTEISEDRNVEKPRKEIRSIEVINKDVVFLNKENSVQKVVPVLQMLEENKIDSKKVVGDINLETTSEDPVYVFEVKEQKKFLGIIPFGEKIIEKRISAVKEIKE